MPYSSRSVVIALPYAAVLPVAQRAYEHATPFHFRPPSLNQVALSEFREIRPAERVVVVVRMIRVLPSNETNNMFAVFVRKGR